MNDLKTLNQKSNWQLGKGQLVQNQFVSMQKQAMDSVKNKSKSGLGFQNKGKSADLIDMKTEVQKTHFNLGTSKLDYVSFTGGTMVEHQITPGMVIETDKNRKAAIEQMRNANFKLPNQQVLRTGQSTYKENISGVTKENQLAGQSAQMMSNLKKTSVKIGAQDMALESETEAAKQFAHPTASGRGADVAKTQ